MKDENELYNMLYEYAKNLDSDDIRNVGNSDKIFEFDLKVDKENIEDPYNEEDWGDIRIKVKRDQAIAMLSMNDERVYVSWQNIDKIHDMIMEKKANRRKEKVMRALNKNKI